MNASMNQLKNLNLMELITRNDGFQYAIIGLDVATCIYKSGKEEVFKLYDDGSEAVVESFDDLLSSSSKGVRLGVEVISSEDEKRRRLDIVSLVRRYMRDFDKSYVSITHMLSIISKE